MKYVLSLSFGKDSMALLLEVLKRKLPLDYVIYSEIMFDEQTSGEHPLMAKWIPQAIEILKKNYNVNVIVLKAKPFVDWFYRVKQRGNHIGDIYGYPYIVGAWCNDRLKLGPTKKFVNNLLKTDKVVEYIGIASDEEERLERYNKIATDRHKYITLADFGISEKEAMEICRANNLLSPKYDNSFRGGCWFCVKQSLSDLYDLYKNYPSYYKRLEEMEEYSHNTFKPNRNLTKIREKFESGYIPKRRK